MKKMMEAILVISVSVLTVSTTATLIHNQSESKHSGATEILKHPWLQVSQTLSSPALHHVRVNPTAGAPQSQSTRSTSTHVSGTTPASTSAAPSDNNIVQNWSAADTQRFLAITDKLVHSLTPGDWSQIEQALTQGSERQAQLALMTTAHKYLTPSDEAWVATHLAGNKPFGPVDVSLLQQAFKQLEGQLTPAEQQLLQQNHLL